MFSTCFQLSTDQAIDMFHAMSHLLPCSHCKNSFKLYLKELPPTLGIHKGSSESAARFCWVMKDKVNLKISNTALPFSKLCEKYETFSQPVSRMEAADLLCTISMQIDSMEQVEAYETFANILHELFGVYGEKMDVYLPLEDKYKSPPTLWHHALKCKNTLCTKFRLPTITRERAIYIYRRHAASEKTDASARSGSRSNRSTRRRGGTGAR